MMIKTVTIYNKIERLRKAIRREGTPAVQQRWNDLDGFQSITAKAFVIYNKIEQLRKAIRREGTPDIQRHWDDLEPHVSIFISAGGLCGTAREDAKDGAGSGDVG